MRNPMADYNPQNENFSFNEYEADETELYGEGETDAEVFSPAEEMELAAELLEISDEAELDLFLGSLIRKAGRAVGKFVKSPVGKAIGGVLKGVAKQALPLAGGALGGVVGGPLGAKLGSSLASVAGKALGLELEGLSDEDREFEAAKQFVRFAGETVKKTVTAPPTAPPAVAARSAAVAAAQRYAPGLIQGNGLQGGAANGRARANSGRWIRRGRSILIMNC
jgi:uncharacterized protein (DUF697 family)